MQAVIDQRRIWYGSNLPISKTPGTKFQVWVTFGFGVISMAGSRKNRFLRLDFVSLNTWMKVSYKS